MFFLTACALCSALALAPTPSPSPTPLPEIAHVYTADRTDTTLRNSARTVYTVTRADIDRYGYRTVAQALQSVPALTVSPLGTIGSGVNVTLRGSGSAQTLILVDGLPAPGSFSNSVELGVLPTTGVDRIEIVEGGGSTLYGTGAIGGIINIITQRTAKSSLVLRDGSFGDREVELTTPNVQYDRIVANNAFSLPDGTMRTDVDYASTAFHANLDRHFGAFDATLRAGLQADHLGAPGPTAFTTLTQREDDQNQDLNFTLAHRTAQSTATLQAGATMQRIAFYCDPVNDPACFQPGLALSGDSRVSLGLRNVVRASNNQLLYGLDLSRGFVRSDDGSGDIATDAMAQSAAYVEDHVDAGWGSVYAGLRGERDGALGGEISPSAGFVWHALPQWSFKGNIASAFRAPNATELYFPFYGNPDLRAERAHVADLTLVNASAAGTVAFGWFGNRTNNLIVAEPVSAPGPTCPIDQTSFTYQACNVDHAFIEGLTFTWRTLPQNGFTAAFNLTDLYRAQDLTTSGRLPNDPVFSGSLNLDYANAREDALFANAGIAAHASGKRGRIDPAGPSFVQPAAFTTIDAYAGFRVSRGVELTLRGMNLGNTRYAATSGFPLPGATYLVELRVK